MKTAAQNSAFLRYMILAVLVAMGSLSAQTATGVSFLRMTVGSRAQAMGDAYTGLAESANGIYYNPGGMGFGLNREIMLYHSEWFEDISVENLTFFFPFTPQLSFATGISYLHTPDLVRYEIDPLTGGPLENGTFGVYDFVILTGIGYRINDMVSVGTNLKFFQEGLEDVTASGVAFDLGVLAKVPNTGFSFGASIQNLGPSAKYIEASESLPMTYRLGAAYKMPTTIRGTFALDFVKTRGQDFQIHPGLEFGISNSFYLRGGYQVEERAGNGMTAGFGLELVDRHRVNYVYVPYGDLGDTHRAEVVFHIGNAHVPSSLGDRDRQDDARRVINRPRRDGSVTPTEGRKKVEIPDDKRLYSPTGVRLSRLKENKMLLTWDPLPIPGVRYHVYAKQLQANKWIKITPQPITKTSQVFNPKKRGLQLQFVVTAVAGDKESDFSTPVYFELPK